jgi:hypothetical protein
MMACRRAWSGLSPDSIKSCACISRCAAISSANCPSRLARNTPRSRSSRPNRSHEVSSPGGRKCARIAVAFSHLFASLPTCLRPAGCEFVISGSTLVLRAAPLRNDITVLLKPEQGRIDCSVENGQLTLADLLDASGDPVSMKRPHGLESSQDHPSKGPLPYIPLVGHTLPIYWQ